jgi:hypothetical protein
MSARESWTKRRAQRPEREEALPTGSQAVTGPMDAAYRCDRCGAQAYVRVLLRTRQNLLFCAHHYRQHASALDKVAVAIQDDTHRLAPGDWPGSPG